MKTFAREPRLDANGLLKSSPENKREDVNGEDSKLENASDVALGSHLALNKRLNQSSVSTTLENASGEDQSSLKFKNKSATGPRLEKEPCKRSAVLGSTNAKEKFAPRDQPSAVMQENQSKLNKTTNANGNSSLVEKERFNTAASTPRFAKVNLARLPHLTAREEEPFSPFPSPNAVGSRRVKENKEDVAHGLRDANTKNAESSHQNATGLVITSSPRRNKLAAGRRFQTESNVNAVHIS